MAKHPRHEEYWRYYELAKTTEASHLTKTLIDIILVNPRSCYKKSKRGRPPVHSKQKLDFACLLMRVYNNTYSGIESDLHTIMTSWNDEPVPDHTTLARHLQTIPEDWLDGILAETAHRCLDVTGGATGPLAVDSSGVETIRYETVVKQDEWGNNCVEIRQKAYWKYHITAIVGLQIVLSALATTGNVHDSVKLPDMLARIKHHGFDFAGYPLNADKGYNV